MVSNVRDINFDDLRGRVVFTVEAWGDIERHNMKDNPKELFDISGQRFSDGWGGSWFYADFGKTWGYDELSLMKPRYECLLADHDSLINIQRALRSDEKYAINVIRACLSGFYGTLYGEQYTDGVTVIKIRRPSVDRDGNMSIIVGMPGPDYVTYHAKDYGKTWALTEEELMRKEKTDA